jgi:hypothetical protein
VDPGFLHEDDAASLLADAFCGPGTGWQGPPREGKISSPPGGHGGMCLDCPECSYPVCPFGK